MRQIYGVSLAAGCRKVRVSVPKFIREARAGELSSFLSIYEGYGETRLASGRLANGRIYSSI